MQLPYFTLWNRPPLPRLFFFFSCCGGSGELLIFFGTVWDIDRWRQVRELTFFSLNASGKSNGLRFPVNSSGQNKNKNNKQLTNMSFCKRFRKIRRRTSFSFTVRFTYVKWLTFCSHRESHMTASYLAVITSGNAWYLAVITSGIASYLAVSGKSVVLHRL